MLRSHLAASLIYLLEQHEAKLGLPEVVEIEVNDHLRVTSNKSIAAATAALERMRMVFGEAPDPEMPDASALGPALERRVSELGSLVLRVPIEHRHHVAAGEMVLAGVAPNAPKSQQFKDCLLWQAIVDLNHDYKVMLVSNDSGFYAERGTSELHGDLSRIAGDVRMVRTIEDTVGLLQQTVPVLNLDPIFEAVDEELRPQVAAIGAPRGLEVEGLNNAAADTFVTGKPGETLVVFEITHDLVGPGDEFARAITEGEVLVRAGAVTHMRLESMELEVYGESGFQPAGRSVFLSSTDSVGARKRKHQLRVPSPGPSTTRL